jgi:hypothetical protein
MGKGDAGSETPVKINSIESGFYVKAASRP